jgi:hypothetical protein
MELDASADEAYATNEAQAQGRKKRNRGRQPDEAPKPHVEANRRYEAVVTEPKGHDTYSYLSTAGIDAPQGHGSSYRVEDHDTTKGGQTAAGRHRRQQSTANQDHADTQQEGGNTWQPSRRHRQHSDARQSQHSGQDDDPPTARGVSWDEHEGAVSEPRRRRTSPARSLEASQHGAEAANARAARPGPVAELEWTEADRRTHSRSGGARERYSKVMPDSRSSGYDSGRYEEEQAGDSHRRHRSRQRDRDSHPGQWESAPLSTSEHRQSRTIPVTPIAFAPSPTPDEPSQLAHRDSSGWRSTPNGSVSPSGRGRAARYSTGGDEPDDSLDKHDHKPRRRRQRSSTTASHELQDEDLQSGWPLRS